MDYEIRPADASDAADVSRVIVAALRETNAGDYSAAVISRVEKNFSTTGVRALIERRKVYVAVIDRVIVGTASLDGAVLRTVFVSPACQKQGVGRGLVETVARAARDAGVTTLAVPSSVTAERFYARLGFIRIRESLFGEERTLVMERSLAAAPPPDAHRP